MAAGVGEWLTCMAIAICISAIACWLIGDQDYDERK